MPTTMNFFEHQDRARRRTGRLVIMFIMAVILIVVAFNIAAYFILQATGAYDRAARDAAPVFREDLRYPGQFVSDRMPPPSHVYIGVTTITLLIIVGGSLYKTATLSRGGAAVAELLGGRPIHPAGAEAAEKTLLNVVEEMSIASGVPVPQVYIMDGEDAINAFAAGFGTDDAVISVTRGTLEKLNRDELQGVIAHEFSHILNGDMRLNLRLIGILHGILLIALIGYMMLRVMPYSTGGGYRRRDRDSRGANNAIILMMLAGAAMVVIGYIGVFFGRLIQAAVSRQREFLADASAVQFTRNPQGIAGALKKIGQYSSGSKVFNAHALETAHLFFSNPMKIGLTNLLATHPPLIERIKAIDPTFDGSFEIGPGTSRVLDEAPAAVRGEALASMLAGAATRRPMQHEAFVQRAGTIDYDHLSFAAGLKAQMPAEIAEAARDPFSARVVVFATLASDKSDVRSRQFEIVQRSVEPAAFELLQRIEFSISTLGAGARLPLVEMALPALRHMSPPQAARFGTIVKQLIEADGQVTLFEFALHRILEKQLPAEAPRRRAAAQYVAIAPVRNEAAAILSALAAASTAQTDEAYAVGIRTIDAEDPPPMTPVESLAQVDTALKRLALTSASVKQRFLDAAVKTVVADGQINVAESELLRAIAATLDIPLPPLLATEG
jgi:Zn-dependent protease with chaperone function